MAENSKSIWTNPCFHYPVWLCAAATGLPGLPLVVYGTVAYGQLCLKGCKALAGGVGKLCAAYQRRKQRYVPPPPVLPPPPPPPTREQLLQALNAEHSELLQELARLPEPLRTRATREAEKRYRLAVCRVLGIEIR